jgi:hypothetical protein
MQTKTYEQLFVEQHREEFERFKLEIREQTRTKKIESFRSKYQEDPMDVIIKYGELFKDKSLQSKSGVVYPLYVSLIEKEPLPQELTFSDGERVELYTFLDRISRSETKRGLHGYKAFYPLSFDTPPKIREAFSAYGYSVTYDKTDARSGYGN